MMRATVLLCLALGGCSTVAVNYQTHKIAIADTTQVSSLKQATTFCDSFHQKPVLVQETNNWQFNMWVYQCQ